MTENFFGGMNLKLDDRQLDWMLNSTYGPVGIHMNRIGLEILRGARRMVGIRSARLHRSLYMNHHRRGPIQVVEVGSKLSYAYLHHEGSSPHVIDPPGDRIMRFRVGGRIVYTQRVRHPGNRGRKYLTIPMERAVRR